MVGLLFFNNSKNDGEICTTELVFFISSVVFTSNHVVV